MLELPIFIDLADQPCLIVGGGVVAERKARLVLRTGAALTLASPWFGEGVRSLDPARVTLIRRSFNPAMLDGQRLVIAATDDTVVNRRIAASAANAGLWCNVVDDPALSTFIFPAIVDRSPVVVAIGTAGTAPVLAQRLKSRIETWLPARIGELAAQAGRWRELVRKRFPALRQRRRFWQEAFRGPIAGHMLAGRQREAEQAFRVAMVTPATEPAADSGEAWLVGAGPGDPELITLKGQRLLSEADVVLYDALVAPRILDYARKDALLIPVGKRTGQADTQQAINKQLVKLVRAGNRVCRLKGGDPFVFGRGGEEVTALKAANLPYQVVPGISAALCCAAEAGFPLTHRGLGNSITLATATVGKSSEPDWALLARPGHTLALYMSVRNAGDVTAQLIAHGMDPSMPATFVQNGTLDEQRIVDGTLGNIAARARERQIASPAMLFVGPTVGLRDQQPEDSTHTPLPEAASFTNRYSLQARSMF